MWKTTQAVNYEQAEPVDSGKTLGFINSFLIDTTEFLNRFSVVCDQRLRQVSDSLQRLEVTLAILESKLESIPGLEGVNADTVIQRPAAQQQQNPPNQGQPQNRVPDAPPLPDVGGGHDEPPMPPPIGDDGDDFPDQPPVLDVQETRMTNREDPRYAKYFKMQRLGIAEPNIIMKMQSEGVDPSILQYVIFL